MLTRWKLPFCVVIILWTRREHELVLRNGRGMYRVVLADDDAEFLGWFRALLEESPDFQVVGETGSGTEAVRLVELLRPDLVIADVDMPGLDGLDVTREVRGYAPATGVVVISGLGERAYERLAAEEGALAFIPKSGLSVDALRQALKRAGWL
jgi:NarL family two-component system response regulator LiaR